MSADRFNAAVSKRIAALATMHNRTEATDKKIREAAAQRLAVVQADIDKLASRAQSDGAPTTTSPRSSPLTSPIPETDSPK